MTVNHDVVGSSPTGGVCRRSKERLFFYVTFSPSRSVRCETNKPPAMRVRVEGYTKKTPNAIQ